MVWSEDGWQSFEEEIFDGRRNSVHRDIQLVDVHAVVVVEFLKHSRRKTGFTTKFTLTLCHTATLMFAFFIPIILRFWHF